MIVKDFRSPDGRHVGPAAPYGDRDHGQIGDGIHVATLGLAVPPHRTPLSKAQHDALRRNEEKG